MKIPQGEYTASDIQEWLEIHYQTRHVNYSLFSDINSDDEAVLKEIGYNRFLFNDNFDRVWERMSPKDTTRTEVLNFCKERLAKTQNPHLLARYNYALLVITKNNLYANRAISAYLKVADFYLSKTNNDTTNVYEFLSTMKELIKLCLSYNKPQINYIYIYLHQILNQSYPLNLKTGILRIFTEEKSFKSKDLKDMPNYCLDIYYKVKDERWQEGILEIGLKLSQRINNSDLIKLFANLLGDLVLQDILEYSETNMAISHINEMTYEKAIGYYRLAKNQKKVAETTLKLEENRTHHKYPSIPIYCKIDTNPELIFEAINQLVCENIDKSLIEIIFPICRYNSASLLPDFVSIKKNIPKIEDYDYTTCTQAIRVDKWGNKHKVSHESMFLYDSFHMIYQRSALLYIPILLCNCMIHKKITIRQFRSVLKKSGFHIPIPIKRVGGYMHIPLYDIVGKGLEDYIRQNNKSFNDKMCVDWRFCIDFLTPKFEFIIRCIASVLGIPVVKTLNGGEEQFITLEKILDNPKLKDIFNDDDILIFKHTFTQDGINIRNEVAHGLLLPQDYSKEVATLVFLCVLRLCKISDYIATQVIKNSESQE